MIYTLLLSLSIYADRLADSLINKLEVKNDSIQFNPNDSGKGEFSECSDLFFKKYANMDYERQFSDVSTENWIENWWKYYNKLIDLSFKKGYDTTLLHNILIELKPADSSEIAELPIAIYFTNWKKDKYIIILIKWEYVLYKKRIENKIIPQYASVGHIKGYIYNYKNQKPTCFMTCN
jgi:hypothetical protein